MIFPWLLKTGFAPGLITVFSLVFISSCSGGSGGDLSVVDSELITGPGTTQLFWAAPAEREDNSPLSLSEIAGYRIYYGVNQGEYLNTIDISDSVAVDYVFTGLETGTYYVVLTTLDTDGRESLYSKELVISL